MTVTTTATDVSYIADGVTTDYALPFYFTANSQIVVYLNTAMVSSGYAVTGAGDGDGGTLVFDIAPANGTPIDAERVLPLQQDISPINNATIFGSTLARGLDFLTMLIQQIKGEFDKSYLPLNKADVNLGNATYAYPGSGSIVRPAINRLSEKRYLTDFIDKNQWPAIRNGTATALITNTFGQGAFEAAMSSFSNPYGGIIEVPEGTFPWTGTSLNREGMTLRGQGRGSVMRNKGAANDGFILDAAFIRVEGLHSQPLVTKTAGAFIRSTNNGAVQSIEDIECHREWSMLTHFGAADPVNDRGTYHFKGLQAFETPSGGRAFWINGGYDVLMEHIIQAGDNAIKCEAGLRVDRCADLRVSHFQLLNALRPLEVRPVTGKTCASLKMQNGYCATSLSGSILSTADGGNIISTDLTDVWFGETEGSNAHGLELKGDTGGIFRGIKVNQCEFPLSTGDGLHSTGVPVQINGGWADGNAGAGLAIISGSGWAARDFRAGADRFSGNNVGLFIGATCDNFIVLGNDFRGNTAQNLSNGAGLSATKIAPTTMNLF